MTQKKKSKYVTSKILTIHFFVMSDIALHGLLSLREHGKFNLCSFFLKIKYD